MSAVVAVVKVLLVLGPIPQTMAGLPMDGLLRVLILQTTAGLLTVGLLMAGPLSRVLEVPGLGLIHQTTAGLPMDGLGHLTVHQVVAQMVTAALFTPTVDV